MLRRLFDIVVSSVVLFVTAPVLIVTAIVVAADGGPVLYRQTRAGLRSRPFEILKVRSMRPNKLSTAELARIHGQVDLRHPELTSAGRWIRRLKIDELPQLVNVLWGDMSLIGPRPTVLEQVAEYTPYQMRRLEIRPGLSGWAQVHGGIKLTWPERILLDVWYVDHRSFLLDLKILWRTFWVVVFGETRDENAVRIAEQYSLQNSEPLTIFWSPTAHGK